MRRVAVSLITAALLASPVAAWAAPADRDAWVKQAEQRLKSVLEQPNTLSAPGTRVAEVRMNVDSQGKLSDFKVTRSSGSAADDALVMDAAEDLSPLPAPPASVMGRPIVVRVAFITPTDIEARRGRTELKPYVLIEDTTLTVPPPDR